MIEKQLLAWKEAEQAAQSAESTMSRMGQSSPQPRVVSLSETKALRDRADALFEEVLAALPANRA
jgi:hypothetical protein